MAKQPEFDIFAGHPEKDPLWIESAQSLSQARERIEQIAAGTPGQYFIFSPISETIVARIETFAKPDASKVKTA